MSIFYFRFREREWGGEDGGERERIPGGSALSTETAVGLAPTAPGSAQPTEPPGRRSPPSKTPYVIPNSTLPSVVMTESK